MKKVKYNRELEEKIDRYVNGQLNDEEIERLWAEAIHDPYYYDYLITAANVKKLGHDKRKANIHTIGKAKRVKYSWMAAAASIVILIGILSFVLQTNVSNGTLNPLNELSLKNVRSVEVLKNDAKSQIKRGINLANAGQVNKALSLLNKVKVDNSKKSIKASAEMNIGIINYNQKNFKEALSSFKNVVALSENNVLVKEKAYWFAGNAYMQLGEFSKAKTAIQNAYNLNGAYRRITGKYLKYLNKKLAE